MTKFLEYFDGKLEDMGRLILCIDNPATNPDFLVELYRRKNDFDSKDLYSGLTLIIAERTDAMARMNYDDFILWRNSSVFYLPISGMSPDNVLDDIEPENEGLLSFFKKENFYTCAVGN